MLHSNTADPYEFAEPIPREEADIGDTDEYNRRNVHGTRKKDASNPYELARAFPIENTADVNVSDEYHHLNRQGVESKETEGSTTTEKQGEYSHLGQHSEKKGSGDVYNVVQKNRKGVNTANQAGDEYNKINLTEQGWRKQRGETPDVYNHLGGVNSPDKAKPGLVREDEYNRINLKEKGPHQRGTTTDVYNRLGGDVTPSGACDNAERDKGPEQGTENYNTLNFDRGDEQTGGSGNAGKKTRQGVQAYDHVQDDFQETYSKPQRDKKERVIDSNYDHVTPS
nr:hypothetical protein BaRGS_002461 [Batillaria attramentaria]